MGLESMTPCHPGELLLIQYMTLSVCVHVYLLALIHLAISYYFFFGRLFVKFLSLMCF